MPRKLLEVIDLKVVFGSGAQQVEAVKGVDFQLLEQQTLGIVGESGSGKSVTALSLIQLIQRQNPTIFSGSVKWWGKEQDSIELTELPEKRMTQIRGGEIALIFQDPKASLNPIISCGKQVLEVVLKHRKEVQQPVELVKEWFEKVKLPDIERIYNAYPHELSGGQLQRVVIAMAMITQPQLLIADEPTTALDVTIQKSILELLNELKNDFNTSIILISHDLGVIAEVCDNVLVMYKGQVMESGSVNEVLISPKHPYTKGLLACRPPLVKRFARLPVLGDFMEVGASQKIQEKDPLPSLNDYEINPDEYLKRQELIQSNSTILKVNGLKTWYPKAKNWFSSKKSFVKAVNDVSFEIKEGETLGIVGESGSGKTTLGKSILGLVKIHGGQVIYNDKDLTQLNRRDWRPIRNDLQMIFQNPYASLNPRMPVFEMLEEPMKNRRGGASKSNRKEKVVALLESVGLGEEHLFRYPAAFSGGQRQRIAIARALAVQPKLMICDESVSSLDVSVQAQVLNLLVDLRENLGLTYIFISHDLSVVRFISDRVLVMKDGKVVEFGQTEAIFQNPQEDYTQKLIEAIPKGENFF